VSTDDDFLAYVGTHWSRLVRVALLLDGPDRAEAAVQEALVRSYQHWARVWQDDRADVDVLTHLLAGIYAPHGRIWRGEKASADPAPGSSHAPDDDDASELVRVLLPLTPLHRDVLVLTYVAELAVAQAAVVLDVRPETVQDRLELALASVGPCRQRDDLR
jgi:DNA-directed RNA polymerase specialized sigma24 family protein